MDYKCPECGSQEQPIIISRFPPPIYQCLECGKKWDEKGFITKEDKRPHFTPLPKHPS